MAQTKPPLYPCDPVSRAIPLPSEVVHELFHLAKSSKVEAVKRVRQLTGAGLREAKDFVDALDRRRQEVGNDSGPKRGEDFMSVLNRIATLQGQRSDLPNQELARELAAKRDKKGIREIAENLWNKDRNIQSDCIKVLYEVGYLKPELIAAYAGDFLKLLKSRNNRLVWGSLIALSTIATLQADELYAHWQDIRAVMEKGTVITVDAGIKTLAQVAAHSDACRRAIFPYLLAHLKSCRPQSVAQHAEAVLVAVNAGNCADFVKVLGKRLEDLSAAAAARVKRVMKAAAA